MGGWEDNTIPTCSHDYAANPESERCATTEKSADLAPPGAKRPPKISCTPTTTIVTGLQHWGCRRGSNHGRLKCQRPSIKTKRPGHSCPIAAPQMNQVAETNPAEREVVAPPHCWSLEDCVAGGGSTIGASDAAGGVLPGLGVPGRCGEARAICRALGARRGGVVQWRSSATRGTMLRRVK